MTIGRRLEQQTEGRLSWLASAEEAALLRSHGALKARHARLLLAEVGPCVYSTWLALCCYSHVA